MYRLLIRSILFLFPAESAHHLASFFLKRLHKVPLSWFYRPKTLPSGKVNIMGLDFPSRLGIGAGFDKNAEMIGGLRQLGFGFVEIGTVTPLPQPGNPKPRLFRLKKDEALINRMGFNNDGAKIIAERLRRNQMDIIIGGNIGKNKITPNDEAHIDYVKAFEVLYEVVDYFVVNVSSPNTPGLRELQGKDALVKILGGLQELNRSKQNPKPILLKIAPDLSFEEIDDVIEIIKTTGLAGIVATNTTISRAGLKSPQKVINSIGAGGLSGKPLSSRSLEVVRYIAEKSRKEFAIIGVGGVFSARDARNMIDAGADLVQLYTGFIYGGPRLIADINSELAGG